MLRRLVMGMAAVGLIATLGAAVYAEDSSTALDTSMRQGRVFEKWDSTVVYGPGNEKLTRVWIPLLVDAGGPLLDGSVVRIVGDEGRILGGTSVFSSTGGINAVMCFGTVDFDFSGVDPIGSNDFIVYEDGIRSNVVGQMLGDGSLVWLAAYDFAAQNNLEWSLCQPEQQTPIPEPTGGTPILQGPGIDGVPGSAYLGTPAAIEHGTKMYVGNSNFDAFTGNIPRGVNIWDYDASVGPSPSSIPNYTYLQTSAEIFANANGVPCDPGDGRQTQPIFAKVNDLYYVVFGVNDTNNGGSARPGLFCVDAFELVDPNDPNNPFSDAVAILPPADYRFVDHQANGGGSNVFENNHFEMNSSGQIAALAEKTTTDPTDPNDPPTWRVLLYEPQFTGSLITGYDPPILIADAGQYDQKPEDELAGPFYYEDPNDPNDIVVWYNSISGVGINDKGNVAFTATYDTGEPFDPNDPNSPTIWNNAAYFYDAPTTTLHQVLREDEVVGRNPNDPNYPSDVRQVQIGLISREDSDAFFGASLADDADVLVVNFRDNVDDPSPSRGVAVVAVGHNGDVDFDNDIDLSDLAALLAGYGSQFGTDPEYDSQSDFDLDGDVDLSDLAELLAHYGQSC